MRLIPPKHIEDTLYTFFETNKTCVHIAGNALDAPFLASLWNAPKRCPSRHYEFTMYRRPLLEVFFNYPEFQAEDHHLCSIYDLHYRWDV